MSDADYQSVGGKGQIDRIGVHNYELIYATQTLEEAASIAFGNLVNGLPETKRSFIQNDSGLWMATITYEGLFENAPDGQDIVQYALKSTYKEEPIESHPKILEIIDKYFGQWQGGRVVFPAQIPEVGKNGNTFGVLKSSSSTKSVKNPFFGVDKYLVLEATWVRMYARTWIPGDILSRVGEIITSPPGNPPTIPDRDRWLVMPPQAAQQGNVFRITEEYQLLRQDTPDELYTK